MTPKIKICGITKPQEIPYLNDAGVDYAGFVFYEKSKRNVDIVHAKMLMRLLDESIQKVAVMVSPDKTMIEHLQEAGFDILQIHGTLLKEALEDAELPVWYAVNLSDPQKLKQKTDAVVSLPDELQKKITAVVVDGAGYGGGKTFDWSRGQNLRQTGRIFEGRDLILAGGLRPENVAGGIRLFAPDVVDVSSGVEGENGKEKTLINRFVSEVKRDE